jgi:hypothetical protein
MRLFKRLLSVTNIQSLVDKYSGYSPSPVSLAKLTEFGKINSIKIIIIILEFLLKKAKTLLITIMGYLKMSDYI